MANISTRIRKLAALACPSTPMELFLRALNEASAKLTGKGANQIAHDDPAFDLVLNDLQESFVRKLSDADLASHITELERIAFGDNTTRSSCPGRNEIATRS